MLAFPLLCGTRSNCCSGMGRERREGPANLRDGVMARDAHFAGNWRRFGCAPVRLAIVFATILATSAGAAQPIVVQGSTTFNRRVMEPHQAEIEAASGQRLTVIPNKTTPGLVALVEGRAQMTMISAPLASEIRELRKAFPNCPCQRLKT